MNYIEKRKKIEEKFGALEAERTALLHRLNEVVFEQNRLQGEIRFLEELEKEPKENANPKR